MAHLEVRDVGVRFGGTVALEGVSLSVSRGEIVGILGPNGAGKTTLLDVISGATRPQRGEIRFDGADVTAVPAEERARLGIARTFQSVELLPSLTVMENVLVGCQSRQRSGLLSDGLRLPRSRRAEILARREATAVLDSLGLTLHHDAPVASLPLGTRRMVEIARALCMQPSLLMLDEAGSGMEPDMLRRLSALIGRLARSGTGVLLIEHDVDFVLANSDFIYIIGAGRVAARGTAAAISRSPLLHEVYLGRSIGDAAPVT
jgi:ABC-type branched-subunit amino acid transport system ATPase component